MGTPTSDWWARLSRDYPALVPFYKAKYAFLDSISPIHTRRADIWRGVDQYVEVAMKTRKARWPSPTLWDYGYEDDAYALLVALEDAWAVGLEWLDRQSRSEFFILEAFLSLETSAYTASTEERSGPPGKLERGLFCVDCLSVCCPCEIGSNCVPLEDSGSDSDYDSD
jgi:hypothetical protein